ncbi:MAG: glycoside hydrolase family 97 catalytic domain-containing protein [Bacteroidaceae bacterium]|nr:glycoside hydrolase family 97 catalytic domain-containing protein [Bacteroidaceae bacterium]
MEKYYILVLLLILSAIFAFAGVKSPDGRLEAVVEQETGKTYLVLKDASGEVLVRTSVGFTTGGEDFSSSLAFVSLSDGEQLTESYTNIHGKRTQVSHPYTRSVASFTGDKGTPMNVELRLFNDGLAFRYLLANEVGAHLEFTGEQTAFSLPTASRRWLQRYVTCYEGDFPLQDATVGQGAWGYPALFQLSPERFALLTEAGLTRSYCATHLDNSADAAVYRVVYPNASEGNGQGAVNPVWEGAWSSPWRTVIVGTQADIVASTMVDDVSPAPIINYQLSIVNWITPGRAAWVYWAYNHGTKDFQRCKQYVDLAAEMGWEYVLFDWEWDAMTNGGKLEDAVAYALSRGVKPWMWYNSGGTHTGVRATPLHRMLNHKNRVEEFTWLKSLGVVGVKVDFFESDKQQMVAYYLDILEDAAPFEMMVNFHGCTVPRGWSRTYPHLMSQEAVYGAEQYNNAPFMTDNGARINCLLPYTRNVVGPMDYTPVAFTNSQHPHRTSYVHELALSVAFESGVQHWADRPEGFLSLPDEAREHMSEVPVVWDETRFLRGYPGESFVVARRSGDRWYVAGLNGQDEPCEMFVATDFLPAGEFDVTVFADGASQDKMSITHRTVTSSDMIIMKCLPQGGFLLSFKAL